MEAVKAVKTVYVARLMHMFIEISFREAVVEAMVVMIVIAPCIFLMLGCPP